MSRLFRVGALLASFSLAATAQAQDAGPPEAASPVSGAAEETAEARRLFFEGVAFVEALDWSRAAERFRAARRLRSSPAVEYNLAAALFELGQLNESEELAAGALLDPATGEELRPTIEALLERIEVTGGKLAVHLEGARGDETVYLDARPIGDSRVGTAMTANLGEHVVEARRGPESVARGSVVVTADALAEVLLDVGVGSAAALAPDPSDSPEPASPGLWGDWRFWAVVGGGAVLVATVVIIAVVAAGGGGHEEPIVGTFQPGVLTWD